MKNTKEKIQSLSGWVSDLKLNLKYKISQALHKPTMLYYDIRNYNRWFRIPSNGTDVLWVLRKPLTITYITKKDGYCPTCHARAIEHGEADKDDHFQFMHADYHDNYERSIFSTNLKYSHTACSCDDLIFEPLEDYYSSGGEQGNPLFTQDCAQWDIDREKGWHHNPLKCHQKQLLPRDWRRS